MTSSYEYAECYYSSFLGEFVFSLDYAGRAFGYSNPDELEVIRVQNATLDALEKYLSKQTNRLKLPQELVHYGNC